MDLPAARRAGQASRTATRTFAVALSRYRQAVATYSGALLAEHPAPDWLVLHRERLNQMFVSAAVRAGELLLASGTTAEPVELARRAVTAQPYLEPVHQLLVSAYLEAATASPPGTHSTTVNAC